MNQQTALQRDCIGDDIEKNRWDESATYLSPLDALLAEAPPETEAWRAVNDRLKRAASVALFI